MAPRKAKKQETSPKNSKETTLSPRKQSQRLQSLKNPNQRVVSSIIASQRAGSPKKASHRAESPKKASHRAEPPKKASHRAESPKKSLRAISPKKSAVMVRESNESSGTRRLGQRENGISPSKMNLRTISPKKGPSKPLVEKEEKKQCVPTKTTKSVQETTTAKNITLRTVNGATNQKKVISAASSFYDPYFDGNYSDFDADPLSESSDESEDNNSSAVEIPSCRGENCSTVKLGPRHIQENPKAQTHSVQENFEEADSDISEMSEYSEAATDMSYSDNIEGNSAEHSDADEYDDGELSCESEEEIREVVISETDEESMEEVAADFLDAPRRSAPAVSSSCGPLVPYDEGPRFSAANGPRFPAVGGSRISATMSGDPRGLSAGGHTVPRPSEAVIDIMNDDDEEEFNTLTNSEISAQCIAFQMSDFSDNITYTNYKDLTLKSTFPGVYASAFHKYKDVSVGFLRINSKTIKPFERAANVNIVYTVMCGEVILKSSAFDIVGNDRVLQKQIVQEGGILSIPVGHPYALENRSDCDAVLQYVVIQ